MIPEFYFKKHKSGTSQLEVRGDLTVSHSKNFKENLIALMNSKTELSLSLQSISSLDVSAIQLVLAFSRACKSEGRAYQVIWPQSETINDLLEKTGIKNALQ
jgi:anti-anti-sigma factor